MASMQQQNEWKNLVEAPHLSKNIRSGNAPPSLAGHPIRRPQRQRPFTDIRGHRTDHPGLHWTSVRPREGLVETHHRRARCRHDLVVSVVIGDGRLWGRQDGVGQVWTSRAGVRLRPAKLPSIVHRMLPVKKQMVNVLFCDFTKDAKLN